MISWQQRGDDGGDVGGEVGGDDYSCGIRGDVLGNVAVILSGSDDVGINGCFTFCFLNLTHRNLGMTIT